MAKQIKFTYKDKEYTLEFTRRTASALEKQGFAVGKIDDMPITAITTLFAAAFQAHHSSVSGKVIDEIYDAMPGRVELIKTLVSMYGDTLSTLMDEPEESGKNLSWTVSD